MAFVHTITHNMYNPINQFNDPFYNLYISSLHPCFWKSLFPCSKFEKKISNTFYKPLCNCENSCGHNLCEGGCETNTTECPTFYHSCEPFVQSQDPRRGVYVNPMPRLVPTIIGFVVTGTFLESTSR